MAACFYIAGCVFTARFPELSARIQRYVQERFEIPVVRCCFSQYKLREFEEKMPEGPLRESWRALPDSADVRPGDVVYSLCHNCANIIEEQVPGAVVKSLWELIDGDDSFPLPDLSHVEATLQDCWRAHERKEEQDAVRSILQKMGISFCEAEPSRGQTRFCGSSLLRAQPPRNPKAAPRHYVEQAKGLFIPHTEEEQVRRMRDYCRTLKTDTVICYCHYCLEGLLQGGKDGRHLAELVFTPQEGPANTLLSQEPPEVEL
ncbi:MAG: hypothetical protein E7655_04465 [Ruminococcaceae bacterium]|nr:hypothetical protein [Oscillospiraceae bacterium]